MNTKLILIVLAATVLAGATVYLFKKHESHNLTKHYESSGSNEYTYYMFEREWPAAVCQFKHCSKSDMENFPGDNFNMHGLWPNGTPDDQCGWPQNCSDDKFDESKLSADTVTELEKYYVGVFSSADSFHAHEWEKHGTCWDESGASGENKEDSYFKKALEINAKYNVIDALKQANIEPSDTEEYDSDEIEKALSDAFGVSVTIKCSKGSFNTLDMCISKDYEAMECPCKKGSQCSGKVKIPVTIDM